MQSFQTSVPSAADAFTAAQRYFLRSFVRRAGAWAIFLVVIIAACAYGLFGLLEPLNEVWPQLALHAKTRNGLEIFCSIIAVCMAIVLIGGVGTLWRIPRITRAQSGRKELRSPMLWLHAIHAGAALSLCAVLFPLAGSLDKRSEGGEAFRLLTPHETPTTTIQFMLFLAAMGSALTTIAARRAMAELDLATRGEDAPVQAMAFEVMPASAAVKTQSLDVAASGRDDLPLASIAPPLAMPAATPAAAWSPHSMLDEEVGRRRQWEWLLMVLALMIIPLSVPHLGVLYEARQAAYKTEVWTEIYDSFHLVPLNSQAGGQLASGRPLYRNNPLAHPSATVESVSCGVCAVIATGGILATHVIDLLAVIWAAVCIIAGPRWRGFALAIGWTGAGVVTIGWLAETYLIQQFRYALTFVHYLLTLDDTGRSSWMSPLVAPSPLDLGLSQLLIPLAILALLTRPGMRAVFGRRRRR